MHKDWPKMAGELSGAIKEVRLGTPEVMKAFSAMAKAATEDGVLDAKTKGDKETTIFFQADKGVDYGDLMEVMNNMRAAGYLKVGLVGLETAAKK